MPRPSRRPLASASGLGRFGEPEEVAGAVLFLCTGASSFVVGADLVVDGGYLQS